MRPIPVMLALLLALSPGAVAVQASAPTTPAHAQPPFAAVESAQTTDTVRTPVDGNTTTVMMLGTAPAQTGFDTPSLSLGSSLATDRGGIQSHLSIATLDQQLQAANSVEQKKQILNRYRYRIENHIISLKAEERQVTQAFSNGTISKSQYLRTLGRIDTKAEELRNRIKAMKSRAGNVPRFGLRTEANTLRGKLVTLEGPVRDRISQMTRGNAPRTEIYVATADTGVVLSTLDGNTYVREIVRRGFRDPSATGQLSLLEVQDEVLDRYPWAQDNIDYDGTSTFLFGATNIYSVSISHTHGDVVAYFDSGTEKVFKEVQYKQLTGEHSVPPGPGVANSSDNLTLVVNRTYPGGPLRVNLTNETGVPLQGDITVAGEPVGRTHADGTLWTLGPAEEFRVTATYRGRTVNVTATPVNAS